MKRAFELLGLEVLDLAMRRAWVLPADRGDAIAAHLLGCDIVHVHDYNPLILRRIQYCMPRRIVYTEHGNFGIGRNLRPSELFLRASFRRMTMRRELRMVFNSRFTKSCALEIYGPQLHEGTVIYNGIALDGYNPRFESECGDLSFRLLFLGRLVPQKGLRRLLLVLKTLRSVIPGLKLQVIGDGPERQRLEDAVRRMELEEAVSFEGYRSDTDTAIGQSDLLVIPSFGEPFGLVALEALRLGKPIAVFADGGGVVEIAERIREDCIAADVDGMVRILSAYHARKLRGDLDPGRYFHVASEFSLAVTCAAYDALYESCLD
jgi:glycosyltransferase involved in cell wall biosynthesis